MCSRFKVHSAAPVCVRVPVFSGKFFDRDMDRQSWGWTDLCVSYLVFLVLYVCLIRLRGLCCNQSLLLCVDVRLINVSSIYQYSYS